MDAGRTHPLARRLGRWRLGVTTAAALGLVAATGCSVDAEEKTAKGHVVIRMSDDYNTLDPALNTGLFMANNMQMFLYDRLVEVNEAGEIVPHLASEWETTPTRATLTIRDDVTCSDGTELLPEHVAASLQRLADPKTEAFYRARVFGEGGAKAITGDNAAGTVTIELKQGYSDLMLGLAQFAASIVCPAGLDDPGILKTGAAGTGPFVLDDAKQKRGVSYGMTRRDDYAWGPQGYEKVADGAPTSVTFRHVESASTAANMMTTDAVDVAYFNGAEINQLSKSKDLFKFEAWDNGGTGLQFNQAAGLPGSDLKFREAIMMAIEPDAYNQAATFGTGRVSPTPYTFNLPCFDEANGAGMPQHDPEGAKALLAEIGWQEGSSGRLELDGKPTKIRVAGFADQNSGPDYLLAALEELGFEVDFAKPDLNGWVDIVFSQGSWDIVPYPYSSSFPSPGLFTSNVEQMNFENDAYWEAVEAAGAAAPEDACAHWSEAERALVEHRDTMNLSVPVNTWFGNDVEFIAPNNLIWPMSLTS